MLKKTIIILIIFISAFINMYCSKSKNDDYFQQNDPNPQFSIFHLFDNYNSLHEMWNNIDGKTVNNKLSELMNNNKKEFVKFSYSFSLILEQPDLFPLLVGDIKETISTINDNKNIHYIRENNTIDSFYIKTGDVYNAEFYSFLDELSIDRNTSNHNILKIMRKALHYVLKTKEPEQIEEFMEDMSNDIKEITREDMTDISKIFGKLLLQSSYPMWIDSNGNLIENPDDISSSHKNLDLGNAAKGIHSLLYSLNHSLSTDKEARSLVNNIIYEITRLIEHDSQDSYKLQTLICTLEDHFTKGGAVYENNNTYKTNNDQIYSDAELGETLKDLFPNFSQLFIRADRPNAMIIDKDGNKTYPLELFSKNLRNINWNPDSARIEESLYDLMRYDIWGRDRVTDPEANHTSFLENLLFITVIASNTGYEDGGVTNEITNAFDPNYYHGHGTCIGRGTLNDFLFSMKTKRAEGLGMGLGIYDLAFKDSDRNYLFRSRFPFKKENKDDYKFYIDQNYGAGWFLAGSPGEHGSPKGGINPKDENGNFIKNGYRPYGATSIEEDSLSILTLGAVIRHSWTGEGPFYYAPKNAPTIDLGDKKIWNIYYRPNGKIYAYVHKPAGSDNWEYIYPADKDPLASNAICIGKLRKKMTHALFTSNQDLSNGISIYSTQKLKIQLGNKAPVIAEFIYRNIWPFPTEYDQQDIINIINNAVQENICYAYNIGDKQYIQIIYSNNSIPSNEPLILLQDEKADNIFTENKPINLFFINEEKERSLKKIETYTNAFALNGDAIVSIQIDDEPGKNVTFDSQLYNHNLWSIDMVINRLCQELGEERVIPIGTNKFQISGQSSDPGIAKVMVNNVSGSINGVEVFFGGNGNSLYRPINRHEYYRAEYLTDYYMGNCVHLDGSHHYSTVTRDNNGNLRLVKMGNNGIAGAAVVEEIIPDNDPIRACSSQEEALFKNYQHFFADKKFQLIVPQRFAIEAGGVRIADLGIIYMIQEANGYAGVVNIRKYRDNHVWAKKGTDGRSDIPGDYRFEVLADINPLVKEGQGLPILSEKIVYDTLDCGTAYFGVIAHNLAAIYRLAFPKSPQIYHGNNSDNLLGSREFQEGDAIWKERNALMPLLVCLLAGLRENTDPDPKGNPIKKGMKPFFDMITPLMKPIAYYQKNEGDHPRKSLKLRLIDDHYYLTSSAEFYQSNPMEIWYGSDMEREYYKPAKLTTFITPLIDSNPYGLNGVQKRCDGVLAKAVEYNRNADPKARPVTAIMKFVMQLSDPLYDDPAGINYADNNYKTWGLRRKFLYGIEQVVSSIKSTKGELTKLNEGALSNDSYYVNNGNYKKAKYPDWMFAKGIESSKNAYGEYTKFAKVREEDFILDNGLYSLIGHDKINEEYPGKGLAAYPDDKTPEDWKNFNKDIDTLADFINPKGHYTITENIIHMMNSLFADHKFTEDQIAGLMYTMGKLFAKHDGDKWIYQGNKDYDNLYRLLVNYLPKMHEIVKDGSGDNYYALLKILAESNKENGLLESILDDAAIPSYNMRYIMDDLHLFLSSDLISSPSTTFWPTLSDLLYDMGKAVNSSPSGSDLYHIYEYYGFQYNY